MDQRGRKSLAQLSVVNPDGVVTVPRIQPPVGMPADEARVWAGVVASKPADWFDGSHAGMLADFCRHTVSSRDLSVLINEMKQAGEIDIDKLNKLLAMRERESRAASSLGTRMRLTQQSTYSARKNASVVNAPKPWEE